MKKLIAFCFLILISCKEISIELPTKKVNPDGWCNEIQYLHSFSEQQNGYIVSMTGQLKPLNGDVGTQNTYANLSVSKIGLDNDFKFMKGFSRLDNKAYFFAENQKLENGEIYSISLADKYDNWAANIFESNDNLLFVNTHNSNFEIIKSTKIDFSVLSSVHKQLRILKVISLNSNLYVAGSVFTSFQRGDNGVSFIAEIKGGKISRYILGTSIYYQYDENIFLKNGTLYKINKSNGLFHRINIENFTLETLFNKELKGYLFRGIHFVNENQIFLYFNNLNAESLRKIELDLKLNSENEGPFLVEGSTIDSYLEIQSSGSSIYLTQRTQTITNIYEFNASKNTFTNRVSLSNKYGLVKLVKKTENNDLVFIAEQTVDYKNPSLLFLTIKPDNKIEQKVIFENKGCL